MCLESIYGAWLEEEAGCMVGDAQEAKGIQRGVSELGSRTLVGKVVEARNPHSADGDA